LNAVFSSEALVCLQSPTVPIHPWALVADLPWGEVEEGASVTVSRGKLLVGRFVLPLAEAEVVDLTFHPPANVVSLEELQERVALIEELLAKTPDPFESEFDRAFVRDRDRILAQWQQTGDPEVLLGLIGRGPGTTPAGDDTLIGLLAGLEVLAAVAPGLAGSRLQATRNMLRASRHYDTSLLASQALYSAAFNRFPEPLLQVQTAVLGQQVPRPVALDASRDIHAAGRTTGRSALLGLVVPLGSRVLECMGRDCHWRTIGGLTPMPNRQPPRRTPARVPRRPIVKYLSALP
jgi:hypothetical protein